MNTVFLRKPVLAAILGALCLPQAVSASTTQSWLSSGQIATNPYARHVALTAGYMVLNPGSFDVGTLISGSERGLLNVARRLTGTTLALSAFHPLNALQSSAQTSAFSWGGISPFIFGRLRHYDLDDNNKTSEPANSSNTTAITYAMDNPINNSTGLALGLLGLDATSNTDAMGHKITLGTGITLQPNPETVLMPEIRVIYHGLKLDYMARLNVPGFSDDQLSQTTEAELDEDRWGIGVGLNIIHDISPKLALGFKFGGDVVYADANLKFNQFNRAGILGAGHPEAVYDIVIMKDQTDWTYQLDAEVSADTHLSKDLTIGARLGYEYYGDMAKVINRITPAGENTDLGSSSADSWHAGLRLSLSF